MGERSLAQVSAAVHACRKGRTERERRLATCVCCWGEACTPHAQRIECAVVGPP